MQPESSPPPAGTAPFHLVVGSVERHEVRVAYSATLRLLTVQVDGRTVYRHCGLVPWATRKAREIRTPGRELHTLIIDPPRRGGARAAGMGGYRIWLDGAPLVQVARS